MHESLAWHSLQDVESDVTPRARILVLVTLAMLAFAGNSLLCRAALDGTAIDAASFTSIRLISGAAVLWLLASLRHGSPVGAGNWASALALFAYAAGFSFAYLGLPAATGALLLFGAVQVTMIGWGLWSGERLSVLQGAGLLLAFAGLVGLLLPGVSAPPLTGATLMLGAGVAWGIYTLRGRGAGDPLQVTAGNFLRTVPVAVVLSIVLINDATFETAGVVYALLSGALASGIGYALWYAVLPALRAAQGATVQTSVPLIAAAGGMLFLDEPVTLRFVLASAATLGGIVLVLRAGPKPARAAQTADRS